MLRGIQMRTKLRARPTAKDPELLEKPLCSVDLLHCRAACAGTRWAVEATARHATSRHSFATATSSLIHLHHDRIYNTLDFLLLRLEFILLGKLVLVQPVQCILHRLLDFLLVARLEFVLELFLVKRVPHRETIVLQAVLRFDLHLLLLILGTVLFRLLYHPVNLGLREPALLVCDGDLVRFASRLVLR